MIKCAKFTDVKRIEIDNEIFVFKVFFRSSQLDSKRGGANKACSWEGADYSFEVRNIWMPEFFKHDNSSLATVKRRERSSALKCIALHHRVVDAYTEVS